MQYFHLTFLLTFGSLARFFLCCACGRKNLAKLLVVGWPEMLAIFYFNLSYVFYFLSRKKSPNSEL